jgi:hypothetical protein
VNTQVKRWSRATGAVLGGIAVVASVPLWSAWEAARGLGAVGSDIWGDLLTQLCWSAGEFVGCLLILLLATLVSDRFLGGRRRLPLGVALTLVAAFATEWYAYGGSQMSAEELVYGVYTLGVSMTLPLLAGAWTLRSRAPGPASAPVADPLLYQGVWESTLGVLSLEPDAVFTLLRAGGEPVAGEWGLDADRPSRVTLRVVAPTALGRGWQTIPLDAEYGPDGGMLLRVDRELAFSRRSEVAELELEYAGGYVGQLEILES